MSQFDEHIESLIEKYKTAAAAYTEASVEEMRVEDTRALEKTAAIARLMQTDNPLNGRRHSASSAEAVVEMDTQYSEFLRGRRRATAVKLAAMSEMYAARWRVEATIAAKGR